MHPRKAGLSRFAEPHSQARVWGDGAAAYRGEFGAPRRHVGCTHIWRISADSPKTEGELELESQQRGCAELAPSDPQAHISRVQVPARQSQLDFHGKHVDLRTGEMAQWVKCLVHKHEAWGSIPSAYVKKTGHGRITLALGGEDRQIPGLARPRA